MTPTTLRRTGALTALAGLVLSLAAFTTSAPAGAAPVASPICNNQKPDQTNCAGGDLHGTLTAEVQSDGSLLFTVAAEPGFGGWSDVKICIPGEPMTTAADCTGSDKGDTLVPPTQYTVGGATGVSADGGGAGYTFACDTSFSLLVDEDALDGDATPSYTVHLSPCAGGTDEAFGTAEAFVDVTTTTEATTTTEDATTTTEATTTTTEATTTTTEATTTTTTLTRSDTPTGGTSTATETPRAATAERTAVLGEQVARPDTAAAAAVAAHSTRPAAGAPLARTGTSTTTVYGAIGVLLVLLGSLLVAATNRRTLQPVPVRVTTSMR